MCLQDYQLGNNIVTVPSIVTLEAAPQRLVAPNPARVGLIITNGSSTRIMVTIEETPTAAIGYLINELNDPLYFTMKEHGDLTTKEFLAFAGSVPVSLFIVEMMLEQSVFQRPLSSILEAEGWPATGKSSSEATWKG